MPCGAVDLNYKPFVGKKVYTVRPVFHLQVQFET